ncbi:MAG: GntR family transcriptional regulator [Lachnospiraceae bacterium]|nr:GntR family transcriptional regulator [Lachnospiraceae bacterium]
MIPIDYRDTRPIYEQVVERFRMLILRGVIKADDKMPSVRNLAVDLSINPNTIQRAYAELERQGYIYTVKGKGNFVSDRELLLQKYKEEIFASLLQLCRTAAGIGITEEELISCIKKGGVYD